jgi:hypothetical protein
MNEVLGTQMRQSIGLSMGIGLLLVMSSAILGSSAHAQVAGSSVSGVRSFDGGVGPLFSLVGPGSLYLDNQGTQGYLYTPGNNFQSYSFRNPTTGQAWSGAVMTLGPQLSIGLIQGANQVGAPVVLPGPPRQTLPMSPIESTFLDEIP